jgi:hypothetical protein
MKLNIDPAWFLQMWRRRTTGSSLLAVSFTRVETNMGVEIQPDHETV